MELPPRAKNLIGEIFERLTVLEFAGRTKKRGKPLWKCECSCNNKTIKIIDSYSLLNGATISCGCYHKEVLNNTSHGKSRTPEYTIWIAMKNRCYNRKFSQYCDYGGRGIIVCERWINSFPNFLEDMGLRPSKEYSIDRIDNNGNYCPENCRWATREEQENNKNRSVIIKYDNIEYTPKQVEEKFGLSAQTVCRKKRLGWTDKEIIETPKFKGNKRIKNENR